MKILLCEMLCAPLLVRGAVLTMKGAALRAHGVASNTRRMLRRCTQIHTVPREQAVLPRRASHIKLKLLMKMRLIAKPTHLRDLCNRIIRQREQTSRVHQPNQRKIFKQCVPGELLKNMAEVRGRKIHLLADALDRQLLFVMLVDIKNRVLHRMVVLEYKPRLLRVCRIIKKLQEKIKQRADLLLLRYNTFC